MTHARQFSDYIVYVDESGDHNLTGLNKDYPLFVLAFCIFHKRHYAEKIIPALENFKFDYFGHDAVVLHEHEIRKQKGAFKPLFDRNLRERFMRDLSGIIEAANFVVVACVIDKEKLKQEAHTADNPYHLALGYCLEGLHDFLQEKQQLDCKTHILVECRGKNEDDDLELEFLRMRDGANRKLARLPFEMLFVDKKANASGLQLADLVARPIGLRHLRPYQENKAFAVLEKKFFCQGGRKHLGLNYEGWGLKILPAKKTKGPDEPTEAITPIGNPQST